VSAGRDVRAQGKTILLFKKINRSDPEMDATLMVMQHAFGFKICKECNMTPQITGGYKT
jgi:hypothetical protein